MSIRVALAHVPQGCRVPNLPSSPPPLPQECHDTDRFLSVRNSMPAYRNALAYVLLSESIPIM